MTKKIDGNTRVLHSNPARWILRSFRYISLDMYIFDENDLFLIENIYGFYISWFDLIHYELILFSLDPTFFLSYSFLLKRYCLLVFHRKTTQKMTQYVVNKFF